MPYLDDDEKPAEKNPFGGESEDPGDMASMAEERAAKEVMAAKDPAAMRKALKAFGEACGWTGSSE